VLIVVSNDGALRGKVAVFRVWRRPWVEAAGFYGPAHLAKFKSEPRRAGGVQGDTRLLVTSVLSVPKERIMGITGLQGGNLGMPTQMLRFVDTDRQMPEKRDAELRRSDFDEIFKRFQPDNAALQAARCSQWKSCSATSPSTSSHRY